MNDLLLCTSFKKFKPGGELPIESEPDSADDYELRRFPPCLYSSFKGLSVLCCSVNFNLNSDC